MPRGDVRASRSRRQGTPSGPDCDPRRWGERYAGAGGGNAKKRIVVAVARRCRSSHPRRPRRHARPSAATELIVVRDGSTDSLLLVGHCGAGSAFYEGRLLCKADVAAFCSPTDFASRRRHPRRLRRCEQCRRTVPREVTLATLLFALGEGPCPARCRMTNRLRVWALLFQFRPRWDQGRPQSPGYRHLSHPLGLTGRRPPPCPRAELFYAASAARAWRSGS